MSGASDQNKGEMMKRIGVALLIALGLIVVGAGVALAQSGYGCSISATPAGGVALECVLGDTSRAFVCAPPQGDGNAFRFECNPRPATPVPTATAVPTAVPPTAVPPTAVPTAPAPTATPGMDHMDMHWHAPGAHGDRPFHEHGDAPPAWVIAAGYEVRFDHAHGTPGETVAYWKHTGFKGWGGKFTDGQEWYGVFHLDTNPSGHASRFHSYQLWIKDATGAVSHFSGWMDFGTGNNAGPQQVITCGQDSSVRPIMLLNAPAPCTQTRFENWYDNNGPAWGPDFGFNINPTFRAGGDPLNPATWQRIGSSPRNVERRIEFAWYANRSTQRGVFLADQFGRVVASASDPICSSTVTVGGKSYPVVCAQQVIQPTLQSIVYPGNSAQRTFTCAGCQFPN